MIKYMSPTDPQRAKLVEVDVLASKIASCETDDQTKRVAALLALPRTIEGCPADIVSDSRRLIDCIDVTDILMEPIGNSNDTPPALPCTLLLFNDKLMLVRRPAAHLSGRQLAGLDEVDKATRLGTLPNPALLRRNGLVCKGVFEITEVVVTDVGGIHMHMFLEVPPQMGDLTWSGRQFRAMAVGTGTVQLNPQATAAAKARFIENLWTAQALFRTRQGRSVVLQGADAEVENRNQGRKQTVARAYYNVYQRRAYLGEQKKSKVILHVDQSGTADPVPFGVDEDGPFVVIRVQPLEGDVTRYTVMSDSEDDVPVEDIIHTSAIPDRVLQTSQLFLSSCPLLDTDILCQSSNTASSSSKPVRSPDQARLLRAHDRAPTYSASTLSRATSSAAVLPRAPAGPSSAPSRVVAPRLTLVSPRRHSPPPNTVARAVRPAAARVRPARPIVCSRAASCLAARI